MQWDNENWEKKTKGRNEHTASTVEFKRKPHEKTATPISKIKLFMSKNIRRCTFINYLIWAAAFCFCLTRDIGVYFFCLHWPIPGWMVCSPCARSLKLQKLRTFRLHFVQFILIVKAACSLTLELVCEIFSVVFPILRDAGRSTDSF